MWKNFKVKGIFFGTNLTWRKFVQLYVAIAIRQQKMISINQKLKVTKILEENDLQLKSLNVADRSSTNIFNKYTFWCKKKEIIPDDYSKVYNFQKRWQDRTCDNNRGSLLKLTTHLQKYFSFSSIEYMAIQDRDRWCDLISWFKPGCANRIFTLRRVLKHVSYRLLTVIRFIEFTATFDSIDRTEGDAWKCSREDRPIPKGILSAYIGTDLCTGG